MTSVYETVVAAAPIVCFSTIVDGAWQTRAALSMLLLPRKRTSFCADVVRLVGEASRREVHAEAIRPRNPDPVGDEVERVVPAHAPEARLALCGAPSGTGGDRGPGAPSR